MTLSIGDQVEKNYSKTCLVFTVKNWEFLAQGTVAHTRKFCPQFFCLVGVILALKFFDPLREVFCIGVQHESCCKLSK
jgi:hypothetical protein